MSTPSRTVLKIDGRSIEIDRDSHGIPFVTATTLDDAFVGQGYATACDRLWHLECDRRRALGRLAAVTGDAGHAVGDAFARRARVATFARDGFALLSPEAQAACSAHATGVNIRLAEGPPLGSRYASTGAPPPDPFEGWHSVAIFLIRHLNFATWQTKLWNARVAAALGPEALARFSRTSGDVPVIVPPGLVEAVARYTPPDRIDIDALEPLGLATNGSNAWAVPGPIVAGDPHRALESPNVYYQIGLRVTDEGIDAAGISFPGVPGIPHFGQTDHVAWGVTNAMADYQDLFIESLPDALTDVRTEIVEVRGGDDIRVECGRTARGVVVIGEAARGVGLALRSTGLDEPGGSLNCVVPMLRARTVDELSEILQQWVEPVNNFVLADAPATLAYRVAGRIPVRPSANAWLPVSEGEWSALLADAELPRARGGDPIVTANQQVTTSDYPHLLGINPAAPDRAQRIWDRITDPPNEVHGDTVSLAGRRFAARAGGALTNWDGTMSCDSREAALFVLAEQDLTRRLTERLPAALRQNPFAQYEPPATALSPAMHVGKCIHAWIHDDNTWLLEPHETWDMLCATSLAAAEAEVGDQTWGDLHHLRPIVLGSSERLNLGPIAGADGCVMATSHVPGANTHAVIGSTARYLWNVADRTRSGWVVPLGVHEDRDHPNGLDQVSSYSTNTLLPVFDRSSDSDFD